jgi:hypothetical protein
VSSSAQLDHADEMAVWGIVKRVKYTEQASNDVNHRHLQALSQTNAYRPQALRLEFAGRIGSGRGSRQPNGHPKTKLMMTPYQQRDITCPRPRTVVHRHAAQCVHGCFATIKPARAVLTSSRNLLTTSCQGQWHHVRLRLVQSSIATSVVRTKVKPVLTASRNAAHHSICTVKDTLIAALNTWRAVVSAT